MANGRRRKWQRGTADMVSIGVGVILMAIVTAGTSAAMVYGREALIRQEHYKTAAYLLRGKMDEVQGRLQYIDQARELRALGEEDWTVPLDLPNERGTARIQPVMVRIVKDRVEEMDDLRNGSRAQRLPPDYYYLKMHARWTERDYAEDGDNGNAGASREITFETAVLVRATL